MFEKLCEIMSIIERLHKLPERRRLKKVLWKALNEIGEITQPLVEQEFDKRFKEVYGSILKHGPCPPLESTTDDDA